MSTLVLIERSRILIFEKINFYKEEYKKILEAKKTTERKSGIR